MKRKKKPAQPAKPTKRKYRACDVNIIVAGKAYTASEVRIRTGGVTITWLGSLHERDA